MMQYQCQRQTDWFNPRIIAYIQFLLYYAMKSDAFGRLRVTTFIVHRTTSYVWQVFSSITTLTNTHLIMTLTKAASSLVGHRSC
jgi:hypothetical protein